MTGRPGVSYYGAQHDPETGVPSDTKDVKHEFGRRLQAHLIRRGWNLRGFH